MSESHKSQNTLHEFRARTDIPRSASASCGICERELYPTSEM